MQYIMYVAKDNPFTFLLLIVSKDCGRKAIAVQIPAKHPKNSQKIVIIYSFRYVA